MKYRVLFFLICFFATFSLSSQNMREIVDILCSEQMGGRFPSTPGDSLASSFIASQFEKSGLKPFYNQMYQGFIIRDSIHCNNIIACIEGHNQDLKNQYIIVGAHYDHLGMGGPDSGSRRPDTLAIHPGADDNASGVAVLIQTARHFASNPPARTMIFAAFGAEEQGLGGSKYMASDSALCANTVLMMNFDMVGHLRSRALSIGGSGSFQGADSLIVQQARSNGLNVSLSAQGYGPSDHTSFYARNIPVIYISSGATLSYHTPFDIADSLNFPGMDTIAVYASTMLRKIADDPSRPIFLESKEASPTPMRARFKVTLGLMPDVTGSSKNGLRADMVVPGKPAHKAGMKTGDIITTINGLSVTDIESYMQRLSELEAGKPVNVCVRRGNDIIELIVNP